MAVRTVAPEAKLPTILCVDDDPDQLLSMSVFLNAEGYQVVTAVSAPDALCNVQACLPSLIITDHDMPGMTGAEFCRRLRSGPATQTVPVILYSALAQPPDATLFIRIYRKPAELHAIGREIRRLLTRAAH